MTVFLLTTLLSIGFSASCLFIAAKWNEKRLRKVRKLSAIQIKAGRVAIYLSLAPGIVLMASLQPAALFVWLGALGLLGWLYANVLKVSAVKS